MKRFTETTKWDDPWFRKLSPTAKLLWVYITDRCNCIGLIELDTDAASFFVGSKVKDEHIEEIETRLQRIEGGKLFIPKFIPFQYGTVTDSCPAHKPILRMIEQHGLVRDSIAYRYPNDRVLIPLRKGKEEETERKGQEQFSETETALMKSGKGPLSISPSMEEVKLCCAKQAIPEADAEWFWNKCEGNGWTNGGKKIKSWPHVLSSWKAAGYLPSQKNALAESRPPGGNF